MKDLYETSKYTVVTFDVFDTLVIRNVVEPADVFDLVGGRSFRYARIAAEMAARRLSREEDITLDEIYRFLPDKLKEQELAAELEVCRVNPEVYSLYQEFKAQGKKIYAISDMYLPKSVIDQILTNCGYELDGVYVSSDIKLSKTTGNLFKYFLRENNLKPDEVLHIGDNEVADIECAEQAGINTYHIKKHTDKLTYLSHNKDMFLRGFINHKLNSIDDRCSQIGYEVLGPVLVSFCQWIHAQSEKYGFDKLFFLSRDMHIVYDAYLKMYGADGIDYLQISRQSLHSALENSEGLCAYLKNKGCFGNVAVVDTGWRCVAQPIIEHYAGMIDSTTDLGGLYLGVKTAYKYISRSKRSSSCFYSTDYDMIKAQIFAPMIECFLGYYENKVLYYSADGSPQFNNEQKKVKDVEKIQHSALQFVSDWMCETDNRQIATRCAVEPYKKMLAFPLIEDIDLLGDLEYDDVKTTKLVTYDVSIFKDLKQWLENLSFSAWKGAYFKRSFKHFKLLFLGYLFFDSLYLSKRDRKVFKGKDIGFLLKYYK